MLQEFAHGNAHARLKQKFASCYCTAYHASEEHVHKPGAYHQWRLLVKHNFQSSNLSGSCFLRRSGAAWRFKWKGQIEANLAKVQSASVNNWPTANDRRRAIPGLRLWTSSNCSERCKANYNTNTMFVRVICCTGRKLWPKFEGSASNYNWQHSWFFALDQCNWFVLVRGEFFFLQQGLRQRGVDINCGTIFRVAKPAFFSYKFREHYS